MGALELFLILCFFYLAYEFYFKGDDISTLPTFASTLTRAVLFTFVVSLVTIPFIEVTVLIYGFLCLLLLLSIVVIQTLCNRLPRGLLVFSLKQITLLSIVVVFWIATTAQWPKVELTIQHLVQQVLVWKALLVAFAYLLVLHPTSTLIRQLLGPWISQINEHDKGEASLANAGQLIGFLERMAVLTMILLSQYAAIGFILAAKSVFRFGDLRDGNDRNLTEYVLLGTFASFILTLFIGLTIKGILYFAHSAVSL